MSRPSSCQACLLTLLLVSGLLCVVIFLLVKNNQREPTSYIEVPKDLKPTAEVRFTALYDRIKEITDDALLNGVDSPLQMKFSSGEVLPPNCLTGSVVQIYGSDRSYPDVISDYSRQFTEWSYYQQSVTILAGTPQEYQEFVFSDHGVMITIYSLLRDNPELATIADLPDYGLYYRVEIYYQEPNDCSWEDNPALVRD